MAGSFASGSGSRITRITFGTTASTTAGGSGGAGRADSMAVGAFVGSPATGETVGGRGPRPRPRPPRRPRWRRGPAADFGVTLSGILRQQCRRGGELERGFGQEGQVSQ